MNHHLTEAEREVLHLLGKKERERFSITELVVGTKLATEVAETIISSLADRGLIDVKVTENTLPPGQSSLEESLNQVNELLERLNRLSDRKDSTKIVIFERVRTRINEELSKATANLEFAVDKTHGELDQITSRIAELRDKIDETALLVDIGEISQKQAHDAAIECRDQISKLEAQRKRIFETSWRKSGITDSSSGKRSEKKIEKLKAALEELEARKLVGEYEAREDEFKSKREKILTEMEAISEQIADVSERVREVSRIGKSLLSAHILHEETFNRLTRACERILEMSPSENASNGK
jgi:dGTP triphosphohydrolase